MNFENMAELDPHTYPALPGVNLLWWVLLQPLSDPSLCRFTSVGVYFVFLVMSVHYRILYSAT
jgi:hypothetical protein